MTGVVAAIGNFDGLHCGHRQILEATRREAVRLGGKPAVITFNPHPRRFLCPDCAPFQLFDEIDKRLFLKEEGIETIIVLPFGKALASLTPEQFVDQILINAAKAKGVVVGSDFVFGAGRKGQVEHLKEFGAEKGFAVTILPDYHAPSGVRAGSSAVRVALKKGDVTTAAQILGRPWRISGIVQHGAKKGQAIGFPTLNIPLNDYLRPHFGVYAVRVHMLGGSFHGIANIGVRPTVMHGGEALLEAHIFDYKGDLYGARVSVDILHSVRDERRFVDITALKAQIAADVAFARGLLKDAPLPEAITE
ncbi:MAG: bifunctional riboflavin kinase/FAD synthetase [Holosporales bacterium]